MQRQNRKAGVTLFTMDKITQTARYRQALIKYAEKYGVTKAAVRYHTNRQYIYRWKKRYDGTLQSLEDRSHRPHSHPNQHRPEEIRLIENMRRRNPNAGLVVFWVKLRQRGYSRSISGLYRFLKKSGQMAEKLPNPKYKPKPYQDALYPGQKVQIDVKYVPASCLVALRLKKRKKMAVTTTNTPSWTSTAVSAIWRHSKSIIHTLLRNLFATVSSASLTKSNVSRPTTAQSLQTASIPTALTKRRFLSRH